MAFSIMVGIIWPAAAWAQGGLAGDIKGLQGVLDNLYEQLLPLCSSLVDVGRAIAGFAALLFIGARVWRHIARAEPVDVYPLLRPFALGLMIGFFPVVIHLINGVMQPVVKGTGDLVHNTDTTIAALLHEKGTLEENDPYQWFVGADGDGSKELWEKYSDQADSGVFSGISNSLRFALLRKSYNLRNTVHIWISEVLQVLYQAASLTIDTLRTFNLLLLAILGPLIFAISIFDGFHHTLTNWFARYLNVFLWLPVANILGMLLGHIQLEMIRLGLGHAHGDGSVSMGLLDTGYLVFMIVGIIGYCTVPSIAGYIVQVGGRGAHALQTTAFFSWMAGQVAGFAGGLTGNVLYRAGRGWQQMSQAPDDFRDGYRDPCGPWRDDPMRKKIQGK